MYGKEIERKKANFFGCWMVLYKIFDLTIEIWDT